MVDHWRCASAVGALSHRFWYWYLWGDNEGNTYTNIDTGSGTYCYKNTHSSYKDAYASSKSNKNTNNCDGMLQDL